MVVYVYLAEGCPTLVAPANGTVSVFGSGVNAVAIYYCNGGFEIVGGRVRICQPGGAWSGVEPICKGMSMSTSRVV